MKLRIEIKLNKLKINNYSYEKSCQRRKASFHNTDGNSLHKYNRIKTHSFTILNKHSTPTTLIQSKAKKH
jgi:hypothetical protein